MKHRKTSVATEMGIIPLISFPVNCCTTDYPKIECLTFSFYIKFHDFVSQECRESSAGQFHYTIRCHVGSFNRTRAGVVWSGGSKAFSLSSWCLLENGRKLDFVGFLFPSLKSQGFSLWSLKQCTLASCKASQDSKRPMEKLPASQRISQNWSNAISALLCWSRYSQASPKPQAVGELDSTS